MIAHPITDPTDARSHWLPARLPVRDRWTRSTHGLAIKDELDEYYDQEINHGRLYPNLDALVEKGLVEKGQLDDRTNVYTLTRRQRELEARREWENQYVDLEELASA